MEPKLSRRENLERLKTVNPRSELDYARNKFIERLKNYLLPETAEVRNYATRPKFYGRDQERELKQGLNYLLDIGRGNRLAENSLLVLSALKEALLDDREKSGQRINSGKKDKARYNKAAGSRYEAWERLIDFAVPRLRLDSKSQIDMLHFMYKFNVNCRDETYEKLCAFTPMGAYDIKSCDKIFDYLCFRMSRPAGGKYISAYAPFVKNYAAHTERTDMAFFRRFAELNLDMLAKADDYMQCYDFTAVDIMLARRAERVSEGIQQELFAKIQPVRSRIDKRGLFVFSELMAERIGRGGVAAERLVWLGTPWLQKLTAENDFNHHEIGKLREIFDEDKIGLRLTGKRLHDFGESIELDYRQRRRAEVEGLNRWIYANPTDDPAELLSLRTVYVNMLSERLIRDNRIGDYNLDAYYRGHRILVKNQNESLPNLQKQAEMCDGPKLDNLRMVLERFYSENSFFDECMDILNDFDSDAKKRKQLQMPRMVRKDYYMH